MPVYEYVCKECKKAFEIIEPISQHEDRKAACPKCRSKKVERRWSRIAVETAKKS